MTPKRIGRPPLPTSDRGWRTRKEAALAQIRELELQKRRGELIEAAAVLREWEDVLRQVRAGVLALPSRVRARLPHLSAHDAEVIGEEARAALLALSDGDT